MASEEWSKLEKIAQSVAESRNAFVVAISERRERSRRIIQVLVDTDEGITIARCSEISRQLGSELDTQNIINVPYELEVSSPGIEKPLKFLRQYKKNIGRKYKVQYVQDNERRNLRGALAGIEGEKLTFTTEDHGTMTLEFSQIIESIEELPW